MASLKHSPMNGNLSGFYSSSFAPWGVRPPPLTCKEFNHDHTLEERLSLERAKEELEGNFVRVR